MNNDLISREDLKESMRKSINERYISWTKTITVADIATLIFDEIEYAPTVELDESVIQAVLNKRCMTAVPNEYLIALHGERPQDNLNVISQERINAMWKDGADKEEENNG